MRATPNREDWHRPLTRGGATLRRAVDDLARVGAGPADIPFMVRLAENPEYDLFHGAVDLKSHDCIHLLLGRGLLAKDEAFVADGAALDKVDYDRHLERTLDELRRDLRIEVDLFAAYYAIERRRYPGARESRRLLD